MQRIKNIIRVIFEDKLTEYSEVLEKKQFISKQLKMLHNRTKLLAYLGRKGNDIDLTVLFPSENLEIIHNTISHSGQRKIVVISENYENYTVK